MAERIEDFTPYERPKPGPKPKESIEGKSAAYYLRRRKPPKGKRKDRKYPSNWTEVDINRYHRTGWTKDAYQEAYKEQGGQCYLCRKEPTNRALDADHDHKTDQPRRLLCSNCNLLVSEVERLGLSRVINAVEYLLEFQDIQKYQKDS